MRAKVPKEMENNSRAEIEIEIEKAHFRFIKEVEAISIKYGFKYNRRDHFTYLASDKNDNIVEVNI